MVDTLKNLNVHLEKVLKVVKEQNELGNERIAGTMPVEFESKLKKMFAMSTETTRSIAPSKFSEVNSLIRPEVKTYL